MSKGSKAGKLNLRTIISSIILISVVLFAMTFTNSILLTRIYHQINTNDAKLLEFTSGIQELDRTVLCLIRDTNQYLQEHDNASMSRYAKEITYALSTKVDTLRRYASTPSAEAVFRAAADNLDAFLAQNTYAMRLVATATGIKDEQLPRALSITPLTAEDAALSPREMLTKARTLVCQEEYLHGYLDFCQNLDAFRLDVVTAHELAMSDKEEEAHTHIGSLFACMLLLVLLYVLTCWAAISGILRPLEHFIASIRKGEPIRTEGVNELQDMALSYNEAYSRNIENQEKMRQRAERDPMTGLLNQGTFGVLKQQLNNGHEKLALLVMDVDYFKHINDAFGHEVGNNALMKIASTLTSRVRPGDYVIRYGGDEFVVIMNNTTADQADMLQLIINQVNDTLQSPDDGLPAVSLSVGAAFSETGFHDQLFQQADLAMYDVKRRGRCGFAVYQAPEDAAEDSILAMEQVKPRILLVDDSEMNRDILCSMLESQYDVFQVSNGLQAIEEIGKKGYTFSAMLLDLVMPVCDGYEVLSYMKKHRWYDILPVIIISSETDPNCINRAYDLGATDFISRPFDAQIVQRRVSNTVGLNLRYKRLTDLVTRKIQEKIEGYDMMLSVLSQVVEFRNQESGDHVLHIGLITELLLDSLMKKPNPYSLTYEDTQHIRFASALHDIGKITIPDEIINKPGKLSDSERRIMETHAAAGSDMLGQIDSFVDTPMFRRAWEICRWHHERYDGNGYPDHLVGDDIPISAQVVAVADVYDALTSERCYKMSISHEAAINMILQGRCGAFNPLLMECLVDIADLLPEKLRSDAMGRKWNADAARMVGEVSHLGEMDMATKMLFQLRFEQGSSEYFQKLIGGYTFAYRMDTELLMMSPALAELLHTEEIVHAPAQDEQLLSHAGRADMSWRAVRTDTSPENPDRTISVTYGEGTHARIFQCKLHTIWSVEEQPQFLGVVGILTPVPIEF